MSNVSNPQRYSPSSSTSSSTQVQQPLADNPYLDPSLSPAENLIENLTNTLALLTQSYKTFLPQTNNKLQTYSNARNQATVQDGRVVVQNVQGVQNRVHGMNPRGGGHIARNYTQPKIPQNSKYYKDKMLLMQAQENGVALDAEQLLFLADLVTDEAGPSYDSNILSEVQDYDHYQDAICAHHEEHAMRDSVQLDHVVDSHADYTSDSTMIPYDQYVKDNEVPVVHSNVSSVPNDAFMMIYNDMCEPHAQSVSNPAKFELTEREQKINEQLRIIISDCNFKEETLKKELHSIKLQLASTINKSLKEKVEDRLIKQDQSLQTVYMLCRPKPYYNELNKVAIGYKNPLCLTRAKQVQPALYNGHEIIKDNHAPAIVHNIKDTLEIAEITMNKMNDKMKDPECVTCKVKIAPHDYSKENFLATFTPQKQLTPEQIFWSNDLIKLKSEALKEQTTVFIPIKALTVYPPNTPATLVPRVLPTKSQVKIHIFTLI
nr:hypothetical protein [Tanacetum cinerariifolium]